MGIVSIFLLEGKRILRFNTFIVLLSLLGGVLGLIGWNLSMLFQGRKKSGLRESFISNFLEVRGALFCFEEFFRLKVFA